MRFTDIVFAAWKAYDSSRTVINIEDISAKVSTNHVYRLTLENGSHIIGKLSYFGTYEHFVEDHTIINAMSNNLQKPFENFLARSLIKGTKLFVHRHSDAALDAWVVFYRPIRIKQRPPKQLSPEHIKILALEFAKFHKACYEISNTLPQSTKTLYTDINHLKELVQSDVGSFVYGSHLDTIQFQIELFQQNLKKIGYDNLKKIPVFTDWNIGNFSVNDKFQLYSRWDYDWFRISSRMIDFYFLSRIVSAKGDQTVFSYEVSTMMEDNFIFFLKEYHKHFPLLKSEILLLKETYRFFILNYVIKDGRYFFAEYISTKLLHEAYTQYFPLIDTFDASKLIDALKLN